jgi:Transposase DDE domain/Transposase domain (DUF772)
MDRWNPEQTCTRQEQFILKRLKRNGKLFAFLRLHRRELFDDAFQAELESMYRDSGAGKDPNPPAFMAMVLLLQSYTGASDATAVELALLDLRWQMVLGCLGAVEPVFSQGALVAFRERFIAAGLDRRLLERSAELGGETGAFDPRKLPKTLRVAIDSSPLEGAGRVEDTINLLAHAGRKIVACAAKLLDWTEERVCREAVIPLLLESSVKKALDLTWSDAAEKAEAIPILVEQLARLDLWIGIHLDAAAKEPPLKEHVETLHQLIHQDLEPDPKGTGGPRIREGVAPDRRVSVEDKEMRHGRKSKSKRFNGYKRHIAINLDTTLVLACAITAANRPEEDAAPDLDTDLKHGGHEIDDLYIDRGYINAQLVDEVLRRRGAVICRPWVAKNGKLFAKRDFQINMRDRTITCPAGETERFATGTTVEFDPEACDCCKLRDRCTDTSFGHGRTVSIADNELLQHRLRKLALSTSGRQRLRQRVPVEHSLAHVGRRQGRRARYRGCRKNLFDLRRASAITNLETIQRQDAVLIAVAKAA